MKDIQLRTIRDEDIELLRVWLNKQYIKQWYNDPDEWLTEVKGRNDEYHWIHHYIVMCDDTAIGFCQYYDCFDAQAFEDWYRIDTAKKMYSIDYLVGHEEYLHKGYGKRIVHQLTELVAIKENAEIIVVQPDLDNSASNHVLMANGYSFNLEYQYYYKKLR